MPDFTQPSFSPAWRILVVENAPDQRADVVALLRSWGYEVWTAHAEPNAPDHHIALSRHAHQQLQDHTCHLVLMDLRLKSDEDPEDFSGEDLAQALLEAYPDVKIIFHSGYAQPRVLKGWPCFNKGGATEVLKETIEQLLLCPQPHTQDQEFGR
ncbi:MAG: response regulator [Anaerolineae bacterium]